MLRDYLARGVLAGVIGGLAYGLYMAVVANPLVEYMEGIAHGDGHGHSHGHGEHAHEHAHAVSETTTAIVSVGSGILWGILLGGFFAVAYYVLEPKLPGARTGKAIVLAGAGFLTTSVAPWLVLPPAAPGAEQTLGIDTRLALYAGLMIVGALVAAASVYGYNRTAARSRKLGAVVAALPVAALLVLVPTATPTIVQHPELAGELVAAFQGQALTSQAALWAVIAGSFCWLLGRVQPAGETTSVDDELSTSA